MGKRISSFRGKTKASAEKRKFGRGTDYLFMPEGVELFKPDVDTKYVIDFMPYKVTDKNHPDKDERNEIALPGTYWYKRPFKVHAQVGPNNDKAICLRSLNKPCPICDYRDQLKKEGGDEDEIKSLYPKERNLYAVMFPQDRKLKGKVFLFDISDYLFQEMFETQLQDEEDFDIFPDHMEGVSVKVAFSEGVFGKNKFAQPTRFDFVKREKQYTDAILEEIPNLDDCFNVLSYEALKTLFMSIPEETDEEEEERPRKKITTKKEEDDEDEPEEGEEEEEDEPESDLETLIDEAATVSDLLGIAKENPDEFKPFIKELRSFTKTKLMKARMLEILAGEPEEEPEEEDEPEEKAPAKPVRKTASKEEDGKCPHGHKFGKDLDEYDDCDDCKMWGECNKKQQES